MAKNGVGQLYNGFGISVVGIIAYRASYFGMFDSGKVILFENYRKQHFLVQWGFA